MTEYKILNGFDCPNCDSYLRKVICNIPSFDHDHCDGNIEINCPHCSAPISVQAYRVSTDPYDKFYMYYDITAFAISPIMILTMSSYFQIKNYILQAIDIYFEKHENALWHDISRYNYNYDYDFFGNHPEHLFQIGYPTPELISHIKSGIYQLVIILPDVEHMPIVEKFRDDNHIFYAEWDDDAVYTNIYMVYQNELRRY